MIFGFSASPPSSERLTLGGPSPGALSFLVLGLVARIALAGSAAGAATPGVAGAGAGATGAGASEEVAGGAADPDSFLGAGAGVVGSLGIPWFPRIRLYLP